MYMTQTNAGATFTFYHIYPLPPHKHWMSWSECTRTHTGERNGRKKGGFKSASPSRGCKSQRETESRRHAKSSRHVWRSGLTAGGNEFTGIWGKMWKRRWPFLRLPVKTPTRIWWSWFVKIIPSDAMFSSAVTRTENSRQGPEPIASNLVGRGRAGGGRGGGMRRKRWRRRRRAGIQAKKKARRDE